MAERTYVPAGQTLVDFHNSDKFFRGIRGPIGSGKTVACCYELLRMAMAQEPFPESSDPNSGWRKTRFAIIRNTYRMLEMSTAKTWLAQFPEHIFGKFRWQPPFKQVFRQPEQKFEAEFMFVALDREEDVAQLLSTEWTGAFINEAREIPKRLVEDIVSRVRRYPAVDRRVGFEGATRPGVVADTNSPGLDHWWPILCGDSPVPEDWSETEALLYQKPADWEFFEQPPALREKKVEGEIVGYEVNPLAENLQNLHSDYYKSQWTGKTRDWIDVYLMNRYRTMKAGKPVYPDFDESHHVYKMPQYRQRGYDLFCGMDFGLTPAAVLMQRTPTNHYMVLNEWVSFDLDISRFGAWIATELGKLSIELKEVDFWGDPSGDDRDQQATTAFNLLQKHGIMVKAAPTNDPSIRVAVVSNLLTTLMNGRPRIKINPGLHYLRNGFAHGYRYRKLRVLGEAYEDKPDKKHAGGRYTHIHDALQYAVLGAGEGRSLLGAKKADVVVKDRAQRRHSVWGRHGPGVRSSHFG